MGWPKNLSDTVKRYFRLKSYPAFAFLRCSLVVRCTPNWDVAEGRKGNHSFAAFCQPLRSITLKRGFLTQKGNQHDKENATKVATIEEIASWAMFAIKYIPIDPELLSYRLLDDEYARQADLVLIKKLALELSTADTCDSLLESLQEVHFVKQPAEPGAAQTGLHDGEHCDMQYQRQLPHTQRLIRPQRHLAERHEYNSTTGRLEQQFRMTVEWFRLWFRHNRGFDLKYGGIQTIKTGGAVSKELNGRPCLYVLESSDGTHCFGATTDIDVCLNEWWSRSGVNSVAYVVEVQDIDVAFKMKHWCTEHFD